MSITPAQSRAARGLLDWPQVKLAKLSNLGESTIKNFEAGSSAPTIDNLAAIRASLEAAGVQFIDRNGGGPGVRLRDAGGPGAAPMTIPADQLSAANDE
jgi:transcriptional regulator with XRE-family HTH domain